MYLFMDTETGGLTTKHSLLTVSCIVADSDFNVVPVGGHSPGLYLRIRHDEYALTADALAVNRINLVAHNEQGVDTKTASGMLVDFVSRACIATKKQRLVPAGHNVSFDVQFLRAHLLDDLTWNKLFTYPFLDTAAITRFFTAAGVYDGAGYSLGVLRRRFAPEIDGQNLHNAEADNLVTLALAKKFASMVQA